MSMFGNPTPTPQTGIPGIENLAAFLGQLEQLKQGFQGDPTQKVPAMLQAMGVPSETIRQYYQAAQQLVGMLGRK